VTDGKTVNISKGRQFLNWTLVLSYLILIFSLSSLSKPIPFEPPKFYQIDKLYHFVEYLILGVLLLNAFHGSMNLKKAALISCILAPLYAFTDELHQYFVPLRDASFFDLIADSLGSWAGVFLGRACFRRRTFD